MADVYILTADKRNALKTLADNLAAWDHAGADETAKTEIRNRGAALAAGVDSLQPTPLVVTINAN